MYGTICVEPKIASGSDWSSRFGWVARVSGTDDRYGFERKFIKAVNDYTHATKKGKGMRQYFFLAPGIYDVYQPVSWKHNLRYFVRVDTDGEVNEINKEDIIAWLEKNTILE